jgi:drug/metabolite transporter (DMT)-like permease
MSVKQLGVLLLLAALWGASFLFMRIAAPVLGPVLLIELRVLFAGIALLVYAWAIRRLPRLLSKWKEYLILGAFNAAIPFTLIATSELHLNSSIAAILNATTPLFTSIVSVLWMKDSYSIKKFAGLILGIFGVVVLVGWSPLDFNEKVLFSIIASILAALFYGIGGVYSKVTFSGSEPLELAIGQQMGAAVFLLPFSFFKLPDQFPSGAVTFSVLMLALFCTALGYLLYFYLMKNVGPTKTLSVTFLVPFFGIVWGSLFLHESIGIGTILGLLITLVSIFMVNDIKIGKAQKEYEKRVS